MKKSVLMFSVRLMFLCICISGSLSKLELLEHPTKPDGSLDILVVGDWGREGEFNQSLIAHQRAASSASSASTTRRLWIDRLAQATYESKRLTRYNLEEEDADLSVQAKAHGWLQEDLYALKTMMMSMRNHYSLQRLLHS